MRKLLKRFAISSAELYKRRFFWIMNAVAVLALGFSLGYLYFMLFPQIVEQGYVPLHYNIHFGVDSFGDWRWIFLAPGVSLAFIIVNNVIAGMVAKKDYVLSYIAITVSTVCSLLCLLAIIHIIQLNLNYYG